MKNSIQLMVFLITVILLAFSCNDSGVNPEDNLKPGRRDYVWEIDTITVYGGYCNGLYASAINDIWISFVGSYNERLQHYDGYIWEPIIFDEYYRASRIVGKSSDDIWLLPVEGNFYHYDGHKWNSVGRLDKDGFKYTDFYSMAWDENNETYVVGQAWNENTEESTASQTYIPIVAKLFNGNIWRFVTIPEIGEGTFPYITYDKKCNCFFILFWQTEGKDKVYRFVNNNMELYDESNSGLNIREINRETYLSKNGSLFRVGTNEPELILNSQFGNNAFAFFGRHEKDIFIPYEGGLFHYNGSDIQQILSYNPNNYYVNASLTDSSIAFVIGGGSSSYIFMGK